MPSSSSSILLLPTLFAIMMKICPYTTLETVWYRKIEGKKGNLIFYFQIGWYVGISNACLPIIGLAFTCFVFSRFNCDDAERCLVIVGDQRHLDLEKLREVRSNTVIRVIRLAS